MDIGKIKKEKSIQELLEFGIINIDKPSGPTSFDVSDFVRKTLNLRKTSHFGTLDPKVTGVLPIALNRACKLTGYFLKGTKEYIGIMRLHEDISLEKIGEMIKKNFLGIISQTPPLKSRVKREERPREIKEFKLIEKNGKDILFIAKVQAGTYIRKLIHDLGGELGAGAHMLELRRTRASVFSEEDRTYPTMNLYGFEKAAKAFHKGDEKLLRKIIIPGEIISEVYNVVEIKEKYVKRALFGSPILKKFLKKDIVIEPEKKIVIFSKNKFIEIAKVLDDKWIFAKPEFVFKPS